ncbi:MAG: hypothetical protein A2X79_05155 [Desulfuromonadaceae bacterium GWB2_53_15]|nr:MAG: hypothetical protein A2X79_05155 [Desulfuromonadaceae bacterium GWB2_53_15]
MVSLLIQNACKCYDSWQLAEKAAILFKYISTWVIDKFAVGVGNSVLIPAVWCIRAGSLLIFAFYIEHASMGKLLHGTALCGLNIVCLPGPKGSL